jgi:quinol monooxygenase YgiN
VDGPPGAVVASVLALALLAALLPGAAAEDPGAAYVVAYIEVAPAAAAEARRLLAAVRDASRGESGALAFEALSRTERPGHFALVEAWASGAAREAHARAPHVREFREKLDRLSTAPYEERQHVALAVAPPRAPAARATAVHALTHVDVVPASREPGAALVRTLAEASRQEPGCLRFDALTQSNRPNHMTVIEAWDNREAFDRHVAAAATRTFRHSLAPLSGSLYDERLYAVID